jgi:hypothetical protein
VEWSSGQRRSQQRSAQRLRLRLPLRGRGPCAGTGRGPWPARAPVAVPVADADADADADAEAPDEDAEPPDRWSITAVPPPALLPAPLEVPPEPGRMGPLRLLAFFGAAPPLRLSWPEAATLMAVLMLAASTAE